MVDNSACRICGSSTTAVGTRAGRMDGRVYKYRHCPSCRFSFVENFRSDYENVYDENYYIGRGGDPLVNYVYESENPENTVRVYEYEGLCRIFSQLCPAGGKWLDFGCGGGGLVKYGRDKSLDIVGSEDGWAAQLGRASGIPILSSADLEIYRGKFDFISAVEVLEHIADPLPALRLIRGLLRPGGTFFFTTGNAEPWREKLLSWSYTHAPDVHISFFEPQTLDLCLKETGFLPVKNIYGHGYRDVIKYKVLKNLNVVNRNRLIDLLPWGLICRVVNKRYRVTDHPHGIAID